MKLTEARSSEQLEPLKKLYEEAFPPEEKKPFAFILQKREENIFEILRIEDEDGKFLGLAIVILYQDLALLDYFAIEKAERGKGTGSKALQLLQERYGARRFFLEIESTKEECDDLDNRLRRKHFYVKNGMGGMDFLVDLFGVNMELMTYRCQIGYEEYHKIFEDILPAGMSEKVRRI